jgi:hypothetical protein
VVVAAALLGRRGRCGGVGVGGMAQRRGGEVLVVVKAQSTVPQWLRAVCLGSGGGTGGR